MTGQQERATFRSDGRYTFEIKPLPSCALQLICWYSRRKLFSSADGETHKLLQRNTKQIKVFCKSLYSSHSNLKCWICYIKGWLLSYNNETIEKPVSGVDEPEEESLALSTWLTETNTDPSRPHQGATATKCQALKLGAISFYLVFSTRQRHCGVI